MHKRKDVSSLLLEIFFFVASIEQETLYVYLGALEFEVIIVPAYSFGTLHSGSSSRTRHRWCGQECLVRPLESDLNYKSVVTSCHSRREQEAKSGQPAEQKMQQTRRETELDLQNKWGWAGGRGRDLVVQHKRQ